MKPRAQNMCLLLAEGLSPIQTTCDLLFLGQEGHLLLVLLSQQYFYNFNKHGLLDATYLFKRRIRSTIFDVFRQYVGVTQPTPTTRVVDCTQRLAHTCNRKSLRGGVFLSNQGSHGQTSSVT